MSITAYLDSKKIEVEMFASDTESDRCVLRSKFPIEAYVRGVKRFSDIKVGEHVVTIGYPRGLEHTLGDGLVSGLRPTKQRHLIQTNAPISPGSSGGGLFDDAGNLIGITAFMLQDSQALNFAIPAEEFWK